MSTERIGPRSSLAVLLALGALGVACSDSNTSTATDSGPRQDLGVDAPAVDVVDVPTIDAPDAPDARDVMRPCTAPADCNDSAVGHVCDTATGHCVVCVTDDHCAAGLLCVGHACVTGCNATHPCATGQSCCSGACVDLLTNTGNCGACDTRCVVPNGAPTCMNGTCAIGMCTAPFADCDRATANGCEASTLTNTAHCGTCGHACPTRAHAVTTCAMGVCGFTCDSGFADCNAGASDGCEVDLNADPSHCGSCATTCNPPHGTAACRAGACAVGACATGFADCDANPTNGCETDTRISVLHCGACAAECPARPNAFPGCVTRVCVISCVAGFADCNGDGTDGCEVDTRTALAHCGSCGRRCAPAHGTGACAMSVCAVGSCADGFGDCDADSTTGCETDIRSTLAHCGRCGNVCPARAHATTICTVGVCGIDRCDAGWADNNGDPLDGCEWRLVEATLTHGVGGVPTAGSVNRVREVVTRGGDTRVIYGDQLLYCTETWIGTTGIASCQTWVPFPTTDEGTHWTVSDPPDWWIATFNSTGLSDHARYRIESHTATRNGTETSALRWFARDWRVERYAHLADGTTARGSLADLVSAARAGTAVTPYRVRPSTLVLTTSGTSTAVAALIPWHVSSDSTSTGEVTIQDDGYHFLQWINTSGVDAVSRWSLGAPTDRGAGSYRYDQSWVSESGWVEVYAHDAAGTATAGTLAALDVAIDTGALVRVQVGNGVFHECQQASHAAGGGAAQCLVRDGIGWTLSGLDVVHSLPNVYREFRYIFSTGQVHTERYQIGSSTRYTNTDETLPVHWYINRQGWSTALTTGTNGSVMSGSVNALLTAVESGADVSILMDWGSSQGAYRCDGVRFDRARNRVGCLIAHASIGRPGGATGYWYFGVYNTDGVLRDYRICYGTTTNCGTSTQRPNAARWFVRL